MRQANQKMRFNDGELALMKAIFAENEDFLFLVRKVMLGFPVTQSERETLQKVVNEQMMVLLYKPTGIRRLLNSTK